MFCPMFEALLGAVLSGCQETCMLFRMPLFSTAGRLHGVPGEPKPKNPGQPYIRAVSRLWILAERLL